MVATNVTTHFESVIGLEVHLAMKTKTKIFCACPADSFGKAPNTNVCPVCLGLPGSLPVANEEALEKAIMFSLALHCSVPELTQFHRKNYFYPDSPTNYQISQYDRPVGSNGFIDLADGRRIGITRCHVEADAGRLVHPTYAPYSLVDLNRAGAPLIEMVTEPDLRTPEETREFLQKVRATAQALGVSDANPEEGKMRADVNVSIRKPGAPLGTKVEVKNLNSFKSVQRALEYELKRQTRIVEDGGKIQQATLGWDDGGQKTYLMRTKEEAADYRYFPDPDLPMIKIPDDWLASVRAKTPELPDAKYQRYVGAGVRAYDANIIAFDTELATFFGATLQRYQGEAQSIANWLNTDVAGYLNSEQQDLVTSKLTPEHLANLITLIDKGTISSKIAKDLLPEIMQGANPEALVKEKGLEQVSDLGELEGIIDAIMVAQPELVERVNANPKAINALLGEVMKASKGKAKPDLVRELLNRKLA